jgi:hypothetical protein
LWIVIAHVLPGDAINLDLGAITIKLDPYAVVGQSRHGAERTVDPALRTVILDCHDSRADLQHKPLRGRQPIALDIETAVDDTLKTESVTWQFSQSFSIVKVGTGVGWCQFHWLRSFAGWPAAACIQRAKGLFNAIAKPKSAKEINKFFVSLPVHGCKLNRGHRHSCKGSRTESVGVAVAQTCKQRALIRRDDRRKLQEIPDEKHLNAAERFVNRAVDREIIIDRIQ